MACRGVMGHRQSSQFRVASTMCKQKRNTQAQLAAVPNPDGTSTTPATDDPKDSDVLDLDGAAVFFKCCTATVKRRAPIQHIRTSESGCSGAFTGRTWSGGCGTVPESVLDRKGGGFSRRLFLRLALLTLGEPYAWARGDSPTCCGSGASRPRGRGHRCSWSC